MATSGSIDYTRTRNELLIGALRLIGKSGRGKTHSAADIDDAAEALELMIKAWQATGIHLWKVKHATLFITKGTGSYDLTGSHCTLDYVRTEVKVAASSGASTIDVDSITGISDGDYIGIELDDGTMQWTTINGAPAGDTITLTDVTTDTVAIDNTVYTYTTQLVRPLKMIDARRISDNDIQIDVVSREEYFTLPTKTATGEVNQVYYDPQLGAGKLYIWPTGSKADDRVQLTFMMPIEDFDSANITPDFPQEWLEAIKFSLASRLGLEYGIELKKQLYLDARAGKMLFDVEDFDEESTSVYFQVEAG